jgi:cation diffusion facilitator family transporter
MRKTERAAIIAAAVYILLAIALLLSAVLLARSVTMYAGGIQTVVRAVACFMVFLGLRLSRRRTTDFPLGLYKLENLVSVIVGLFILFGAYETAKEALRLMGPESEGLSNVWIPVLILVVCAALAGVLAWYKWKVGRKENSPSLKAEARHSLGSMCACLLLALGLGLEAAGVPDMGAVVALLVVALLAWLGVAISLDGLKVLLDASVEKDVLEKVRSIAEDDDRVREVFEVEGRNSGSYRFIDLNLTLATHDLREASAVSRQLEKKIREEIENVDHITVEFSPEASRRWMCAVPLAGGNGDVSPSLWQAERLAIVVIDRGAEKVVSRQVLDIPYTEDMPGAEVRLAAFLGMRGVDVLLESGAQPRETSLQGEEPTPCGGEPPGGESAGIREALDVLTAYGTELLCLPAVGDLKDAERALLERFASVSQEGGEQLA